MSTLFRAFFATFLLACAAASAQPARPNILWITAEDMSANLGCYGDKFSTSPALDSFAGQSVRYTHAFATAPVCAPSRVALITGVFANTLGNPHLRCRYTIPDNFKGFPFYLRQAGYFCSNNVKTDYNLLNEPEFIKETWDRSDNQAHWRQRRPGQPFFSVFNIMMTHQSRTSAWPYEDFEKETNPYLKPEERHDPAYVPLPPYYPDTPTVRRTVARYYDTITAMDKIIAGILKELEADGLADDTIVFFYSDHGMGLPRGKRLLHDSGMHVPLLVRFPEKFRHLAPAAAGATTDRLVSFVDFGPTVLSLAGVAVPAHMQGKPFLGGQTAAPRQHVFGARDRVDEAFDLSRSVRDQRWLYIRNYMPHLSWHQPEGYSDQSDMRREITALAAEGKLNAAQLTYVAPNRPIEELYDTQADPHQLRNLAGSAEHRDILERLRREHRNWLAEIRDVTFLSEHEVAARSGNQPPYALGMQPERYPMRQVVEAAGLVGRREELGRQLELLNHPDAAVRYWAVVGLRNQHGAVAPVRESFYRLLKDNSASVRIEVAGLLCELGNADEGLPVLTAELRGKDWDAALHAARTLQSLGSKAAPARPAMKEKLEAVKMLEKSIDQAMFIRFALEAALNERE